MSQDSGQSTRPAVGTLPNQAPRPGAERGDQRQEGGRQEERRPGGEMRRSESGDSSVLQTEHGRTRIADGVVAKVAGMAAREIGGVHAMGRGMTRAFGAVRGRLGGSDNITQGVSVEVGERQAAVDLDLVVEYGVAIPDLAAAVRENVINEVEHMTGLEVVEVNITVDDIHLPGEDDDEDDGGEGSRSALESAKEKVRGAGEAMRERAGGSGESAANRRVE
ncbi:hypothetical protein GCM10009678_11030 [Actinomadura kijaniata]|uniref:Putative alkaline shock family protein YloU n=1 Tax=Actinomadura namibiensis TaxID=182080 RepID=A0A7W3LN90_ACTNM|nr:putative alkaline shock family protein YloU [Actinomadura namibiensis]